MNLAVYRQRRRWDEEEGKGAAARYRELLRSPPSSPVLSPDPRTGLVPGPEELEATGVFLWG